VDAQKWKSHTPPCTAPLESIVPSLMFGTAIIYPSDTSTRSLRYRAEKPVYGVARSSDVLNAVFLLEDWNQPEARIQIVRVQTRVRLGAGYISIYSSHTIIDLQTRSRPTEDLRSDISEVTVTGGTQVEVAGDPTRCSGVGVALSGFNSREIQTRRKDCTVGDLDLQALVMQKSPETPELD
ncbi:unnamed protein product, partial [Rhizoctonia solani]